METFLWILAAIFIGYTVSKFLKEYKEEIKDELREEFEEELENKS